MIDELHFKTEGMPINYLIVKLSNLEGIILLYIFYEVHQVPIYTQACWLF